MRNLVWALTYMAVSAVAIPAMAAPDGIEDLRAGTMKKLVMSEAKPGPAGAFVDQNGKSHELADWRGKYLVVNFWATWCAPCRAEMPELDALQGEFGGEHFDVLTIGVRSKWPGMVRFFEKEGIENLPLFLDEAGKLSANAGVLGLPITLVLDPEGNEIGRLRGDAEWHSDSARAIVAKLLEGNDG